MSYATEKITHCLEKYISREASAHVVLSVEKRDHIAEVQVHSKGHDVAGKAVTGDLYSAIDKLVETIEAQLRKQKDKQLSHQKHPGAIA
jgi:putative sigma-54 modulation protein